MVLWRAPHAEVKIDLASNVTIAASAALDTFFGSTATTISAYMKNISVVVPEGDVEQINFLGVTSSFQNSNLDQKPFGMGEVSGTLILKRPTSADTYTEMLIDTPAAGNPTHLFFGEGTDIPAAGTTHRRYQAGSITTGDFDRPESAWLINITDGTEETNIVLDNAFVTKYGEVKIDGADGHWEVDVNVKCKNSDFYMEWKN